MSQNPAKKILIIVDNPHRDLNACVLLALTMAEKGFECFLSPMSQAPADTFAIGPDHVVLNYLRRTNEDFVRDLSQCGISWSIADTEGGVFTPINDGTADSYTSALIDDQSLRNQISGYFVWGNKLFQQLKEKAFYPLSSLRLTGTPRTDFLHPTFRNFFKESKNEPSILINTSFSFINPKFRTLEDEIEDIVNRFGYQREFAEQMVASETEVMKAYIQLSKELAELLPEKKFILRPHPFESFKPYEEALGHLKNIQIICEKPIEHWLVQASAVVHFECTTAIEAALMGKPVFSLSEFNHVRPVPGAQKLTYFAANALEMSQFLRDVDKNSDKYKKAAELDQIISEIYFQFDGKAHERIADELALVVSMAKSKPLPILWKHFYFSLRSVAKFLYRGFLVPPGKRFSLSEVQDVAERLSFMKKSSLAITKVFGTSAIRIGKEART